MNRETLLRQGAPRHDGDAFSRRHPPMSAANRAKIFAPFAALRTYSTALNASEAHHAAIPCPELSDDAAAALDAALKLIFEKLRTYPSSGVPVELTFFEPYIENVGYVKTRRGKILSIHLKKRTLMFANQDAPQVISFTHLLEVHFL